MTTIFNLFIESGKYERQLGRRLKVFFTLLKLYIVSKFSKDKQEVSVSLEGYRIYAYDYPTLIASYREIFLRRVYDFNTRDDKPFIIDCGAHMGMSVLYFKKLYPSGRIWAFEPNPSLYALLEKNVSANKLSDVKLFSVALSAKEGVVDVYVPPGKGSQNSLLIKDYSGSVATPVEVRRLSTLMTDEKVSFMKIDVEGEELNIVDDLVTSRSLDRITRIVVEYHRNILDNEKNNLEPFLALMRQHNFSFNVRSLQGADWMRNNNIVISFRKNKA